MSTRGLGFDPAPHLVALLCPPCRWHPISRCENSGLSSPYSPRPARPPAFPYPEPSRAYSPRSWQQRPTSSQPVCGHEVRSAPRAGQSLCLYGVSGFPSRALGSRSPSRRCQPGEAAPRPPGRAGGRWSRTHGAEPQRVEVPGRYPRAGGGAKPGRGPGGRGLRRRGLRVSR